MGDLDLELNPFKLNQPLHQIISMPLTILFLYSTFIMRVS